MDGDWVHWKKYFVEIKGKINEWELCFFISCLESWNQVTHFDFSLWLVALKSVRRVKGKGRGGWLHKAYTLYSNVRKQSICELGNIVPIKLIWNCQQIWCQLGLNCSGFLIENCRRCVTRWNWNGIFMRIHVAFLKGSLYLNRRWLRLDKPTIKQQTNETLHVI